MAERKLSVGKAILIGQLVINIPVTIIIVSITVWCLLKGFTRWIGLGTGFVAGWAYWSLAMPKWRNWVLRTGVDEASFYKWARRTFLLWNANTPGK